MEFNKGSSKKKKNRKSLSQSVKSQGDHSGLEIENQSAIDDKLSPHKFTVLIDSQYSSEMSKSIKTRHAVYLHPSIVKAFGGPWYFYILGKEKTCLCVPYRNKSVKTSTIVFFKDSMGFSHEESIELYPYPGRVSEAGSVTVAFDDKISSNEEVKDQVLDILRNKKFFCAGMKFNLPYIKECEFSITSISLAMTANSDSQISTTDELIESSEFMSRQSKSFAEMTSEFSGLSLADSTNDSSMCYSFDPKSYTDVHIPTFFTLSSRTSVVIQTPGDELVQNPNIVPSFADIVGLNKELQSLKTYINNYLAENNPYGAVPLVFISGPSGTGKSMILEALSNEFDAHIEHLLWYNIYSKTHPEGIEELREIFKRSRTRAPSIVLIDDYHYLISEQFDLKKNVSTALFQEIKNCIEKQVVIVAASNDPNAVKEMSNLHNIDVKDVCLQFPDVDQRESIIIKLLEKEKHNLLAEEIKQFASKSHGFAGKDLKDIITDVSRHQNKDTVENVLSYSAIEVVLQKKKLTISNSEVKIKKVKWEDIGGVTELKEKLKNKIEHPLKCPEIYKRFNVKPPRGILLFGPPGCSKTMVAKAIATECDFHFISKNVSDIHSKYVGDSEKAVSDLFVSARAYAPCIIFLDEIDGLIPSRGSSTGSGVEDRVVNTFLQEMDGIKELNYVIVVAATNRPDRIDEAFLRHGRINEYIYIPLPDLEARKEILYIHKKNRKVDPNLDFNELAVKTEGYSGAEIANIWNEAAFQVLEENSNPKIFRMNHFEKALQVILPKTDQNLMKIYDAFNSKYCSNG